jgi:hypothetical protein
MITQNKVQMYTQQWIKQTDGFELEKENPHCIVGWAWDIRPSMAIPVFLSKKFKAIDAMGYPYAVKKSMDDETYGSFMNFALERPPTANHHYKHKGVVPLPKLTPVQKALKHIVDNGPYKTEPFEPPSIDYAAFGLLEDSFLADIAHTMFRERGLEYGYRVPRTLDPLRLHFDDWGNFTLQQAFEKLEFYYLGEWQRFGTREEKHK